MSLQEDMLSIRRWWCGLLLQHFVLERYYQLNMYYNIYYLTRIGACEDGSPSPCPQPPRPSQILSCHPPA